MTSTTTEFTLWQNPGWGSALVEAQLAAYGLPTTLIEAGDVFTDPAARARMAEVNPLAQIPTLRLPNGAVMTESAAITLHLADLAGSDLLVPGPQAPERAEFLRWLVFLVANIYPTFTYADDPQRFVADDAAATAFRARVDDYAKAMWRIFMAGRTGPWVLGKRFSALDIFVAVMVNWRPRGAWFDSELPLMMEIAAHVWQRPELHPVAARNFEGYTDA